MKVTMLGVGNGFSKGVWDNNCLIEYCGVKSLIDCGTTAWMSLDKLGIAREEITSIFLTHLHFDHSGGVESAALYGAHISKVKPKLVVPSPVKDVLWEHVLKGTISNPLTGFDSLDAYFDVISPKENEEFDFCNGLKAWWFQTRHVEGKFSCGLVIDGRFLYTSDMVCDLPLLERMIADGIEIIYHDCQIKGAQVHADLEQMCGYPIEIQNRIHLMHHGLSREAKIPDAGKMTFIYQHETHDF